MDGVALLRLFESYIADPTRLTPFMWALSAAAVVCVLTWPFLNDRRHHLRLHHVVGAERRMRKSAKEDRQRQGLVGSVRHARPKRVYAAIVERLKLDGLLKDKETRRLIYQAGLRGPAAPVQVAATRVICAAAFGAFVFFYLAVVLRLGYPTLLYVAVALVAAVIGWKAPVLFLKNRLEKRRAEIRRNWPDAMDLLLICVESGMSIEVAFRKVAEEIATQSAILSEELALTTAELSYLPDRQQAYRRFAVRTDVDEVRSVATSLVQAEKFGTPIGSALRVLSQESRALRMQAAEKKAAALPPKLTVPMIMFFLPVLFAVIMTPAIIQIMED